LTLWVGVTALQLLTFVVVATVIVDFVTWALRRHG
jgi:hypothetical protein